jgi:hypothetical protein
LNGQVYAPANDGTIHPLDANTGAPGTPISSFDTTRGAVTTPVAFRDANTFFYGVGNFLEYGVPNGSGSSGQGGTVSPVVFHNGSAYFTTSDGLVHQFFGANWSAATSGSGCAPAPVAAGGTIYAGGCNSISAFEAGLGALQWSVTTPGPVYGLAFANNVLYACVHISSGFGGNLVAYTYYLAQLWIGGSCNGTPVVANGTLYANFSDIFAYNTPDFGPSARVVRPQPAELAPDYRLQPQPYRKSQTAPLD